MNLMNLVRLCGVVAIGWTVLALGFGVFRTKGSPAEETSFFLPEPALHEAVAVSQAGKGAEEYRLVDRSTGQAQPLPLPEDASWGLVTVSPWRDQEGNLQAVGRWSRFNSVSEQPFCGLGLFRLSDSAVVRSIELDVLPTGRPCWVPGRPGDLLFPAGDGQLHVCHLTGNSSERDQASAAAAAHRKPIGFSVPYPVTWRCDKPGEGNVYLCDPVWPVEKPLQRFVFVSLRRKATRRGSFVPVLYRSGGSRCRSGAMKSSLPGLFLARQAAATRAGWSSNACPA